MQNIYKPIRSLLLFAAAVLLVGGVPMSAYAQSPAPVATEPATTDSQAPPPEPPKNYTYNPDTGRWDSDAWVYDPVSGNYVKPTKSTTTTTQPEPAQPVQPVVAPATTNPADAPESLSDAVGTATAQLPELGASNATQDTINTDASIDSKIGSDATTGNALVGGNTIAGSAGSGDATAQATVINTIHSTIGGDTAAVSTFEADIYGNVTGDITIYPSDVAGASKRDLAPVADSRLDATVNSSINNDISLNATTGDATVSGNTRAGDATTGNANAVLNLVNLINSIITANKSFIGTINIHGNLNGDILVSPSFIPQLIASNISGSGTTIIDADDSQSIINNISLNARSGQADVSGNTSAGSATSGQAATNLTVLDLSGRQVVASNSLLVFVNVLGKWVGVIVDAPIGTTAAMLGSGVSSDQIVAPASVVNADTTSSIVNNVNLAALTGDASVNRNTHAGNAQTGNATASANVLNVTSSSLSLSDWFGILFINVFGIWDGSFGVNTSSGDVVAAAGSKNRVARTAARAGTTPPFRMGFTPHQSTPQPVFGQPLAASIGGWGGLADEPVAYDRSDQAAVAGSMDHNSPTSSFATSLPKGLPANVLIGAVIVALGALVELVRRRVLVIAQYFR